MTLDSKRCKKQLLKEAIDQYIQDMRQVFQVWHNLCGLVPAIVSVIQCIVSKHNYSTVYNNKQTIQVKENQHGRNSVIS